MDAATLRRYFCVRGRLAVTIREKTTRQLLKVAELKTGDYFGEAAIVTGEPRSATVTAMVFCELFMLNKKAFADATRENAEFQHAVESQVKRRDLRNALSVKMRKIRVKILAVVAFLNTREPGSESIRIVSSKLRPDGSGAGASGRR